MCRPKGQSQKHAISALEPMYRPKNEPDMNAIRACEPLYRPKDQLAMFVSDAVVPVYRPMDQLEMLVSDALVPVYRPMDQLHIKCCYVFRSKDLNCRSLWYNINSLYLYLFFLRLMKQNNTSSCHSGLDKHLVSRVRESSRSYDSCYLSF